MKNHYRIILLCMQAVLLAACAAVKPDRAMDDSTIETITAELEAANQHVTTASTNQLPPADLVNQLLPPVASPSDRALVETRFDLSVDNASAKAVFLGLIKDTGYNLVVHPEVDGNITLNLQNVTVPEVLTVVSDIYGYPVKRNGNLYQIMPAGIRTEVFKINYLNVRRQGSSETRVSSGSVSDVDSNSTSDSSSSNSVDDSSTGNRSKGGSLVGTHIITSGRSDFWNDLRDNLTLLVGAGENRKVVVNPQSGIVIVKAMPREIDVVRDYLQSSELILKRQVILEAKILEVTLSDAFQSGINWTAIGDPSTGKSIIGSQGSAAIPFSGISGVPSIPGSTGIPNANSSANGIFGLSLSLNDFTGIIDLLELQGTVQVLSSPRISTVNNQKAVIKVGTDEFFVTEVTNTVTTSSGGSTNTPSVELTPFFSGISLDVTPQISDNGDIVLHVHPTVSEVVEQQRSFTVGDDNFNLPLAQSTIRESDSIIFAKSDQVVVLGGLIQTISQDDNAATPWVSKVPLLGNAFKQKSQSSTKRELVILLKPRVLSDEAIADNIASSLERVRSLHSAINPGR